MAVFLTYPSREEQRRSDGANCVVVSAADEAAVPAAARALVANANDGDFDGWAVVRLADTPHADFRSFIGEGTGVVGRSPLPSLGRGGSPAIKP